MWIFLLLASMSLPLETHALQISLLFYPIYIFIFKKQLPMLKNIYLP